MLLLIFLSSGLFLGWSLGANDASNVFGTAVGTRMIKFKTAAVICSVFVILGAYISGAGATHTLGKLGAVNAIGGSFMVAFAAALTVLWMTRLALPVSTSQAIVGAIIGWNFFSGSLTDYGSLLKIVTTWALCPLLAAFFALIFFKILKLILSLASIHLFRMDAYTRVALIVVGAFGSYSLGANNIANVMGVFVTVAPFPKLVLFDTLNISSTQQLFLLGGLAIAVGVYTYSYKVMTTVGQKLYKLTPQAALVVVLAESTVLFLFASQGLESWLIAHGLPPIPLVPVSSSQAVIGAVIGIALAKGGRNIQWRVLGNIALGWVTTPVIAGILSFFCLFFLQNVFLQKVYNPIRYRVSAAVMAQLQQRNIHCSILTAIQDIEFANAQEFMAKLNTSAKLSQRQLEVIMQFSEISPCQISDNALAKLDRSLLNPQQIIALYQLKQRKFYYFWQLQQALASKFPEWRPAAEIPQNRAYNQRLQEQFKYLRRHFQKSQ